MSAESKSEKKTAAPVRALGRPRTKFAPPPMEIKGVVESPDDPCNVLELRHQTPTMFKTLFTYFKNLGATEIPIRCDPEGLTMFALSKDETCRVVARIPGNTMGSYFCEKSFWILLRRGANVDRLFASIDQATHRICIKHREDAPGTLSIVFTDCEIDKDCTHDQTLSLYDGKHPKNELLAAAEAFVMEDALAAADVSFQLTAQQFKKTVVDSGHQGHRLKIMKVGASHLRLTTGTPGSTDYSEVYRAPEKIDLVSNLGPDQMLEYELANQSLQALAKAMVTKSVRLHCPVRNKDNMAVVARSKIEMLDVLTVVF